VAACGSDSSTGPSPSYPNVAGSYAGPFAGVANGVVIDTRIAFTLTQSGPDIGGSFALTGTLSDGVTTVDVQGTGVIDGTIGSGTNPSVQLTVTPASCPHRPLTLSGPYDTSKRLISLTGTVQFFDSSCNVTVQSSAVLVLQPA
jgi:hypothetical protein